MKQSYIYLKREQYTANGTTKGYSDTGSSTRAENLASFCGIPTILLKETGDDISYTDRIVHTWPFLANRET